MRSLAPFKTRNIQYPTLNPRRRAVAILGALLLALGPHHLHAQVGNDNPTGASGIFNGQAGGCGYDPYTANATRSITDVAVAGAVGAYPLALVRTANSRSPSTTGVFGWAGGWNHNYNWILEDSSSSTISNFHPTRYTVDFPDGRVETFRAVTWDSNYRVRSGPNTPAQSTSAGVRERFVPLNLNTMFAYLILPDGGQVEFKAVQFTNGTYYWYKYHATAIIDPYGLRTQLVDEVVANQRRRLVWVIEPAGRWLHFVYTGTNSLRIDHIDATDGRTVNYYYIYCNGCRLDHVVYYNDANWTARYQYIGANVGGGDMPPLLWTADDPMYSGPMKRIAYDYKPATPNNPDGTTPVYGQILRERYWDGVPGNEASGAVVSTLTVGSPNNNPVYRTETRGDNKTRTFIYNGAGPGYLAWASDFMGRYASQGYDAYKYINSVTDRRGNTTDYTSNPITGNVTQIQYPLTQGDTPGQTVRPTVNYTYVSDYYLASSRNEGGHTTTFTRDSTTHQVTRVDYPDGGYETFTYNGFRQVLSHRMITTGTETFTYDAGGLKQTYRDPSSASGNPTARYQYDTLGRVSAITNVLGATLGDGNHTTSFSYNSRGQVTVTTLAKDPNDNVRHTITNNYNPDGMLANTINQINQMTSYTYDDYRRLKSVTLPARGDGAGAHTTYYFYDANGIGNDYRYTDSSVTYITLPSGKKTRAIYDDNRRKSSVTAGYGTADSATTSYGYDNVGNLTRVTNPRGYATTTAYDERNRPSSINDRGQITTFTYDTAGRKKTINRPNGQVITYEVYDEMNRLKQLRVKQTPDPDAVTKYTYYAPGEGAVGLLHTMQDPRLVATNSTEKYEYLYDSMGRKTWVRYPKDSSNSNRVEGFTYDSAGRLVTFSKRSGNIQTFTYDALNRLTGFSWNDGLTPSVTFGYDAGSRLTDINNANAAIHRLYWNDNLLRQETQGVSGLDSKTVSYTYDADGNRAATGYSFGYTLSYTYTGRNQLRTVNGWATYTYDENGYVGDLTSRALANGGQGGTRTQYTYDALDRVTWVTHSLNGTTRNFNYAYDALSNDRLWVRRLGTTLGDIGDVFQYDYADQVTGVLLNVQTPQNVGPIPWTIGYDANGNRTSFAPYGTTDTYQINYLNQYTSRNAVNATYDNNGNLVTGVDGSSYTYDAQNRLTSATVGGVAMYFTYDGLNRQVTRTVGRVTTWNVWDGWDLLEEYAKDRRIQLPPGRTATYVHGTGGLIAGSRGDQVLYYYQDASGSTSHLADANGTLLEWYRYDLQGTPIFYDPNDNQLSASNYSVRHLFTGQQWYGDIGLYDLRNRFYSPDIGRFLQPDPIGFRGDRTNLYRYCRNNPVTRWDPLGLQQNTRIDGGGAPEATVERVTVYGDPIIHEILVGLPGFGGPDGFGGPGEFGLGGHMVGDKFVNDYNPFPRPPENHQPSVQHPAPSVVPAQNPPPPVSLGLPLPSLPYTPPINAVTYGNYVPINPYTNQPIWFPSGTSLEKNIAEAKRMNAFQYAHAVTHQWNYKNQGFMYEPFGNFNAGLTGRAAGFPSAAIQFGAGVYQGLFTNLHDPAWGHWYSGRPWGDDPVDQFMIDWGVRYYNSGEY